MQERASTLQSRQPRHPHLVRDYPTEHVYALSICEAAVESKTQLGLCSFYQAIKPVLMPINHNVSTGHFYCRLTNLTFLCKNAKPMTGKFFEQPCVNNVESVRYIPFYPAVPCNTCNPFLGWFEFYNLRFDWETKSLEEKRRIRVKFILTFLFVASI